MMLETQEQLEMGGPSVDQGYRNCRQLVKRQLKPYLWAVSNVGGDNRKGIDAILTHLLTTIDMLDLESSNGLSLDVWHEIRDDLSDAFLDKSTSADLIALVDAARRYDIPKQYLFDPLRGADLWIRNRKFQTYADLEAFCSHVGGATMASLVPVLGFVKPDYELPAIACGKAIMMTQLLANCVSDMKCNRVFIAQEDLQECEVDVPRLKMRRSTESAKHLVRLYASRLEKLFVEAGHLISCLDYDGRRSISSILAMHWKMMSKMQQEPESILSTNGILARKELLALKSRHLLGMESKLSFVEESDDHHH